MVSLKRNSIPMLAMCNPIYLKCRSCKFVKFISPTQAKCRHFIFLNNPYIVEMDEIGEDNLYLDIEIARGDNGICGKNATYYRPRFPVL